MKKHEISSVDEYIAAFPEEQQQRMQSLRHAILKTAPAAEECISYQMPAYKQHGVLVYFACYKNHIGFYPTGVGIDAFKDLLTEYVFSKGAIQFPHSKPLPIKLVKDIVKFRLQYNKEKAAASTKAKKK